MLFPFLHGDERDGQHSGPRWVRVFFLAPSDRSTFAVGVPHSTSRTIVGFTFSLWRGTLSKGEDTALRFGFPLSNRVCLPSKQSDCGCNKVAERYYSATRMGRVSKQGIFSSDQPSEEKQRKIFFFLAMLQKVFFRSLD